MLPLASTAMGPEADTATVPVALGTVIVLLLPLGVAKVRALVKPLAVAVRLVELPPCSNNVWLVEPIVIAAEGVIVLTVKIPPIVTVVPLSVMIESPIACAPVNLASLLVVPPVLVTPPVPTATQVPPVTIPPVTTASCNSCPPEQVVVEPLTPPTR